MGAAEFEVDVDTTGLEAEIKRFEKRGGDLSQVMSTVAEHLVAAVSDRFEAEGDGQWPPLAPATIAARRKGGRGAKILQDTGRWAGSHRAYFGRDFAEAASDTSYAIYHVSKAPRKRVPYRSPYDLNQRVYDEAVDLILEAVTG